ncbi:tetratricopeptide repeat protein [Leeuwenhoekiella sp. W20_SRS_FM14]|uniref:tetratricopeptide repeat protein n=1 Tax=Leeuwenhoekiella sp. W20_SRS_FM14 TaxID=3240270 RepID=UPI003F9A1580
MLRLFSFIVFVFCISVAGNAQDELARNYADQGAFEKAALSYEELLKESPTNANYIHALVEVYHQLKKYDAAETLLSRAIQVSKNNKTLLVDLGYTYQLQGKTTEARTYYDKAIASITENAAFAYQVGNAFQSYSLLDEAIQVYTYASQQNPRFNFESSLARIYGEQGKIDKMFNSYLDLILKDEKQEAILQRYFNEFITEDPENEANQILKKVLLSRMQEDPNLFYNRKLSWLFIQQKEYNKAFLQEKAIAKRSNNELIGVLRLVDVVLDNEEDELATSILNYIIENTLVDELKLQAHQKILEIRIKTAEPSTFNDIKEEYKNLLSVYGSGASTLDLQTEYAHFLAFSKKEEEAASDLLQETLKLKLNTFEQARVKMELADILLLQERFNAALIYYSQIQKLLPNDPIAQEARFKVAKTSYFKGDFEWAKTQLKVLKSSATQLIANDAQDLYLLITDNAVEDSTLVGLKAYARAELLQYQNRDEEALAVFDSLLIIEKGKSIEDEALLAQAILFEKKKNYAKAEENYLKIIQYHNDDILADDAYYKLGNLYANVLQEPEKAKAQYEQIIFNFADSIFYVEAQQKYRKLRGDAIN